MKVFYLSRPLESAVRLKWNCYSIVLIAMVSAVPPTNALGITIGQVDSFENGTTQGWVDGSSALGVLSGGPAGSNDRYFPISSGGNSGIPRLLTFNDSQWLGNFLAAGVTGIELDLKNFGSSVLPIRIAIREGTGGSSTPGYASTIAFNLAADGLWHHAAFPLDAGSLSAVNSPQPLDSDLANVADFRLLSSVSPALIGDAISARIGVDNITAVPEPATIVLLAIGLMIGWSWFNRRRCSTTGAPQQRRQHALARQGKRRVAAVSSFVS